MEAVRSPIVGWLVELEAKDDWDLDLLVEHFRSRECAVVKDANEKYYLTSDHFRGIQDHREVVAVARPLMERMNGIAKIIAPWFHPINSHTLVSVHENGNRGIAILAGPLEFRVPSEIPLRELLPGTSPQLGTAEAMLQLAERQSRIATALRIYGTLPPTWQNLFNVYEVVKEDVGGEHEVSASGWIDEDELIRFKATANNPAAIGDQARHQKQSSFKRKPKHKPMSHEEAKAFLNDLLKGWLSSKVRREN